MAPGILKSAIFMSARNNFQRFYVGDKVKIKKNCTKIRSRTFYCIARVYKEGVR